MAANTKKTKYIIFRNQGVALRDEDCNIVYNANEIGAVANPSLISPIEQIHGKGNEKHFKLLGLFFDKYLTFEHHICSLSGKISRSLYAMRRVRNLLPKDSLRQLYFALVHSYLSYCILIYSCATQSKLKKIIIKQKEAIRVVANASFRQHTPPLFKDLQIMPPEKMIELAKLAKFMHNYTQDRLPLSFAEHGKLTAKEILKLFSVMPMNFTCHLTTEKILNAFHYIRSL